MIDDAVQRACELTGDLLVRLEVIVSGLEVDPDRMRANLDLTGGMISSEAIMLGLGQAIGRQTAVQAPRMNSIMERWIGSCRRELPDRTLGSGASGT
jgi:adenylosuccinate lyase